MGSLIKFKSKSIEIVHVVSSSSERNLMIIQPLLIQCFEFCNDDWNMVTYRDYHGTYQEQPFNHWFVIFR